MFGAWTVLSVSLAVVRAPLSDLTSKDVRILGLRSWDVVKCGYLLEDIAPNFLGEWRPKRPAWRCMRVQVCGPAPPKTVIDPARLVLDVGEGC